MMALRYIGCVALLCVVMVSMATAMCPSEIDAVEFRDFGNTADFDANEAGIIDDNSLRAMAINADDIKEQMTNGDSAPSDELKQYIDTVETELAEKPEPLDIIPYYQSTCPAKWYTIQRWTRYNRYIYTNSAGQKVYRYCWTYTPVTAATCVTKSCQVKYDLLNAWDYRYRCFEDYRSVHIWAYCYDYIPNVGYKWLGKIVTRMLVPKGCCCSRYWPWFKATTADVCPVGTA